MLVPLKWLREFAQLPADSKVLELTTSRVAEIEDVISRSDNYQGLIVAQIKQAKEHPNADKLGVYQVDVGSNEVQVVAGDKTLKTGDKVAYIAPGQIIPSTKNEDKPLIIESTDLRGETSQGMLASSKEVGWGDDHEGVLVLDTDLPAGTDLVEAYDLDDKIIDIENKSITHRPDCFGLIGLARDISAACGKDFTSPKWYTSEVAIKSETDDKLEFSISIDNPDRSARYTALSMSNIAVNKSPASLQSKLYRAGIKSISNVVDVSNIVMIETAQPIHIFDYDKLQEIGGGKVNIGVRTAKKGERLLLLDESQVDLDEDDLLITVGDKPIALAGVMGGMSTAVDTSTQRILIESANFSLHSIRRSAMRHGQFTEAAARFMRGPTPSMTPAAISRAVELLKELTNAQISSDLVDEYPKKFKTQNIKVDLNHLNSLLGTNFDVSTVANTLKNAEVQSEVKDDVIVAKSPEFRADLNIAEDIIEDVGRLKGYDQIQSKIPSRPISPPLANPELAFDNRLRSILSSFGGSEVLTYNFTNAELIEAANQDLKNSYKLTNSKSPDLRHYRLSVLPGLLSKIYGNFREGYQQFGLFEIGVSHNRLIQEEDLPVEQKSLAMALAAGPKSRSESENGAAYFWARSWLEQLFDSLNVGNLKLLPLDSKLNTQDKNRISNIVGAFDQNRAMIVCSGDTVIGVVGEFSNQLTQKLKLPLYSGGFELNLDSLLEESSEQAMYEPISGFPSLEQDITLAVDGTRSLEEIHQTVISLLSKADEVHFVVRPKDSFKKESSRHLTFNLVATSPSRTLTTKEVNELVDQLADDILKSHSAQRI